MATEVEPPSLGLARNWLQLGLLGILTLLVGGTMGVERVALPPLASRVFGVTSILYTVSFISAFGAVKAVMNLVSGRLSDRHGRRPLLLLGWAFAVPYVVLIIFAQSWVWVIWANAFLGVNQALTWTMAVTSMIDLAGPANRGLAVGINEACGYVGVGLGGFAAGFLVTLYGLRPAPYLLALAVAGAGLLLTIWPIRESVGKAREEQVQGDQEKAPSPQGGINLREGPGLVWILRQMSWRDRGMMAVCQAGMVNKFADSLMIGILPLYLLVRGLKLWQIGLLVGVYAWVWGLGQVPSGQLADWLGRRPPILVGAGLVAVGVAMVPLLHGFGPWLLAATVMGLGMALIYPNLISAVGDVASPRWRGGGLGVYRLWRDGGYAVGPLVLGGVAALFGLVVAFWVTVALTIASAGALAVFLGETHPRPGRLAAGRGRA